MLIGLGHLGSAMLELFARDDAIGPIVACDLPGRDGEARCNLARLGALAQGCRPDIRFRSLDVTIEGALAEAIHRHGVELAPLLFCDADGKRLPQDRLREQLAALIGNVKPDLLHANSLSMGRLAGPVADELRVPGIAHLRDIVSLSRRAIADLNG